MRLGGLPGGIAAACVNVGFDNGLTMGVCVVDFNNARGGGGPREMTG